jgi:hypothetical protein
VTRLAERRLTLSWHFRESCLMSEFGIVWSYSPTDALLKMLNRKHGLRPLC